MTERTDKKLRRSVIRDRIYGYLCSTKEHPSAEMIYDALKDEYPDLSLGTVYRNLKQLEELGKVIRVTSVNDRERYDAFCGDHAHFVCDRCCRVLDMPHADMEKIKKACNLPDGVGSTRMSIVLGGVCADCSGS